MDYNLQHTTISIRSLSGFLTELNAKERKQFSLEFNLEWMTWPKVSQLLCNGIVLIGDDDDGMFTVHA